ncbi:hypothetical protein KSP40_PGU018847 [Platanthera guangdongensis]|uniref:Ubiquitin-like protease family profile domain-containing protein n=1 Tax=Platanthera guangdongensis TaxID=2320717 RepID=A0ABR2LM16_9ASPA
MNTQNTRCLISHLTRLSVKNSEVIIMSCHLTNHWALLVCRIKELKWEFYDSMKSKRHRSGLPGLVRFEKNNNELTLKILNIY